MESVGLKHYGENGGDIINKMNKDILFNKTEYSNKINGLNNELSEQKSNDMINVDQLMEELDKVDITEEELKGICESPLKGISKMPIKSFDEIQKIIGTENMKESVKSEIYKGLIKNGFILGTDQRKYNGEVRGRHMGLDYMVESGTEVNSIYDGEIVDVITPINNHYQSEVGIKKEKEESGFGNMLLLKHSINEKIFYSEYAHIAPVKNFKLGDKIKKGETLGVVGQSFSLENGNRPSHLHFNILKDISSKEAIQGYSNVESTKNHLINPLKIF